MFKIPSLPVHSNRRSVNWKASPTPPLLLPPPPHLRLTWNRNFYHKASRKRENLLLLSLRILLTDLKSRSQPEQWSGTLKRKQKEESWSFLLFLCLQEWLEANVKKQGEAKPSDNPVLVVKDIEAKQGKLDRELLYLLNKAKYYVPKPKVNETGTNHVFFCLRSRDLHVLLEQYGAYPTSLVKSRCIHAANRVSCDFQNFIVGRLFHLNGVTVLSLVYKRES